MSRKKTPVPLFGATGGPGFSTLRTASGELVASALSRWRRAGGDRGDAIESNLGWLDRVYLVPVALARSWAQFQSVDQLVEIEGKKKTRLRGIVGLDGKQWAVTGPMLREHGEDAGAQIDLEHLGLTELVQLDEMVGSMVGRVFTFAERFAPEVLESLGRNFRGIGPVYAKAGNEPLALGYNARVFPVEGLELGQWFALDVPRLEVAA